MGRSQRICWANLPTDFPSRPPAGANAFRIVLFKANLLSAGKEICVHTPPGLDWFELIEWYAFRFVLLISFLYTLWQVLKHKLKE